jgi:hypothetical protein
MKGNNFDENFLEEETLKSKKPDFNLNEVIDNDSTICYNEKKNYLGHGCGEKIKQNVNAASDNRMCNNLEYILMNCLQKYGTFIYK